MIRAAVISLLAAALCFAAPPNIVLMVTDDQGIQAGCYGDKTVQTPHLDRLASQGIRMTHAFCTTASCSASRSVILTGLYNHANGQYGLQHSYHNFTSLPFVRGLPVLLKQAGYRTCCVGKFHVQPEPLYHFDAYTGGGRGTQRRVSGAEEFLREAGDQPFFLYFCPTEPHRAGGRGFGNPQTPPPGIPTYDPDAIQVPPYLPDNPDVRRDLAEYYQASSRADAALGHLLDLLEKTGHAEDTLVIFISDNGPPFPGAKTTLYEPGVHLPCVIRLPGKDRKPSVCNAMMTWADITPTLLEVAGAKAPYPLHGRSLLPVLSEENPAGWDEVYLSHTFHEVTMYYPMRVIRTRRYKLILNLAHELSYPFASDIFGSPTWQSILKSGAKMLGARSTQAFLHRPRWELYDLQKDPNEVHNLAEDPDHAAALADLRGRLRAWQEQTKDPWVIKYEHE